MERETFDRQFNMFQELSIYDKRFDVKEADQVFEPFEAESEICYPYLLHCAWAMRKLTETRPFHHVDVGSYIYFVALAAALTHLTFVDIRPTDLRLPNLDVKQGDILNMPYLNNTIYSLSCLHTLEHVGLGRYGDRLDPQGDRLAARELSRVLAPAGQLLIVVPMNRKSRVQFNSCRLYSYEQVVELFPTLKLEEFTLIKGKDTIEHAKPEDVIESDWPHNDTGCFVFTKE
jgi:SAM-dependent methyltransferase